MLNKSAIAPQASTRQDETRQDVALSTAFQLQSITVRSVAPYMSIYGCVTASSLPLLEHLNSVSVQETAHRKLNSFCFSIFRLI